MATERAGAPAQPAPQPRERRSVLRFPVPAQSPRPTLLLVGNPNVGKSLIFKQLTGRYVTVSNFPGTTVDVVRAPAELDGGPWEVIDTPGVNDLDADSEDARVTAALVAADPGSTIVQIADAKNLRRALLLTLQLAALRRPMVLVLNMLDELHERGGRVDAEELEERLGIPVVPTVAIEGRGIRELASTVGRARPLLIRDPAQDTDGDNYDRHRLRLDAAQAILRGTYRLVPPRRPSLGVRLGFWAMHPVRGLAVLAMVLAAIFWFVGLFGAGTLVDLLEGGVFQQRLQPAATRAVDTLLPFPHLHATAVVETEVVLPLTPIHSTTLATWSTEGLATDYTLEGPLSAAGKARRAGHDFLVGEYGILTMALPYAFAIVLPIVLTFFLAFSVLEDSGYLPRLSILLNRLFRSMGLNGKAVLPMVLGLGCDTMATMATRILASRKERLVTTMLLALAVPCSAQLGVLLAMAAQLSWISALTWGGVVVLVLFGVGGLGARCLPGEPGDFLLEIPPLRRPQLANVWWKARSRLSWYLREVIPLFILGTAALFVLDQLRLLTRIGGLLGPLTGGWLGLPAESANAFLVGFFRRDFGAVYLLDAATGPSPELSPHQILVAMVTITLFMPCIANFLMIAKEHGWRVAWGMAGFIFPFAFLVGGVVHHVGAWIQRA